MSERLIKRISTALYHCIEARESHKRFLAELRQIAVNECGFDQEMVMKSSPVDLLDGYVKGVLSAGMKD